MEQYTYGQYIWINNEGGYHKIPRFSRFVENGLTSSVLIDSIKGILHKTGNYGWWIEVFTKRNAKCMTDIYNEVGDFSIGDGFDKHIVVVGVGKNHLSITLNYDDKTHTFMI